MTDPDLHALYMSMALQQAACALEEGEVPTGCVIIDTAQPRRTGGALLGKAHNQVELLKDPTAHAEILAITQAAQALGDWRLTETALYVTKEPCAMCAGAIIHARIPLVVYGTPDPLRGGLSVFGILNHPGQNHRCRTLAGIRGDECLELIQTFFRSRRK